MAKISRKILRGKWFLVFILILASVPSFLRLIRPGFFPTHDFIYIARIYQMDKSLKDGQFPVRWVPDFRQGEPLFNFYAPLPYYLGSVVHTLGFSFLDSTKILFALSFLLSTIFMYFLGKELFGGWGALVSSILYLYAPYRSVDVYVRGTLNEAWVFVFFPLIFLYLVKLYKNPSLKNTAFLSLSLAGLFYTHNIMTILFLPFLVFFSLFIIYSSGLSKKFTWRLFISALLGFGLSTSFLLPAFFEKKFVQTSYLTSGYFDYLGHFVAIRQWFFSPWGYGASLWGPVDDMSFQLGQLHWLLIFAAIGLYILTKQYKDKNWHRYLLPILIFALIISLFLQHNKSTFIWQAFPILAFTQFPWRFLAISVFLASIIGGYGTSLIKKSVWRVFFALVAVLAVVTVNYKYFRPKEYYLDSKDEHYMGEQVLSKDDRLPKDYLPIWVKKIKLEKTTLPFTLDGEATVSDFKKNSQKVIFNVDAKTDSLIEVPITYFPGWQLKVDGKRVNLKESSELGLINFEVPFGKHIISLKFANTPVRTIGNLLSLISAGLIIFLFKQQRKSLNP